MLYKPEIFFGKRVTIMGLGLLGRGVGDAKFIAECGAKEIVVTDLKNSEELKESVEALSSYKNIKLVLGTHRLEDFKDRDFILKAAGVPIDSPYIAEARKNNIPIEMSSSLFAFLSGIDIVAVTGTRGKSTVTHLIYEILTTLPFSKKVFLGGNVKGISTLALLSEVKLGDVAVLELDSWQLQGFGERKISPHIAVFTTFFPDHLNYYKNDLERYLDDKANIFLNQKSKDFLVLGSQVASKITEKYGSKIHSKIIEVDTNSLPSDWQLKIPGEHNRYNCAIALKVGEILGVDRETVRKVVENFKGVKGRLEFVREFNGVKIYNDTTATTPDATLAGLRAVKDKNTVLIMGGADKSLEMSGLISELPKLVSNIVLLPGSGSNRIESDLMNTKIRLEKVADMNEAVTKALAFAKAGDTVILSPAFASFGPPPGGFKNEFDRGEQFDEIVGKLK